MSEPANLLSLAIFLPTLGAIAIMLLDKKAVETMRMVAFATTAVTFALTLAIWSQFDTSIGTMQMEISIPWVPSWNINYQLGIDGLSLPLVVLTGLISMLSCMAAWSIKTKVKGFLMLFLILETGMMGCLSFSRLLPVLRLLGSDAVANVLPDWSLGGSAT